MASTRDEVADPAADHACLLCQQMNCGSAALRVVHPLDVLAVERPIGRTECTVGLCTMVTSTCARSTTRSTPSGIAEASAGLR